MHRPVEEVEFTIFDTETTGLDPASGERIVEIAGVRFRGEEVRGTFATLVNPGRAVSAAAYAVNHITQEMLASAPPPEKVFGAFLDFFAGSCLCSYNLPFDLGFLEAELSRLALGLPARVPLVDVLAMARKLMPGLPSHSLASVARGLSVSRAQEHRALSDVEITRDVFRILRVSAHDKGILEFGQFLTLFGLHTGPLTELIGQKTAQLQEAIDQGMPVALRYFSRSSASVSERIVRPREIKDDGMHAYLVGFCERAHQERTFRIDHIVGIKAMEP